MSLSLFPFQDYLAWTQRKPETQKHIPSKDRKNSKKSPAASLFPSPKGRKRNLYGLGRAEEIPRMFSLLSFPGHRAILCQQQHSYSSGSWAGPYSSEEGEHFSLIRGAVVPKVGSKFLLLLDWVNLKTEQEKLYNLNKEKKYWEKCTEFRHLWDNIKRSNIGVIRIPEGEEKEGGAEKLLKEIMSGSFQILWKT